MATPESKVVREILADALQQQLPAEGVNLVLLGQRSGDRKNLERALYGVEIMDIRTNRTTKEYTTAWKLGGTAPFGGSGWERFATLSGVLWFRLVQFDEGLYRAYKLYLNPHAKAPLRPGVVEAIEAAMARWAKEGQTMLRFLLPCVRVELLIRTIRTGHWDDETQRGQTRPFIRRSPPARALDGAWSRRRGRSPPG